MKRRCFELVGGHGEGWQVVEHTHDGNGGRLSWWFQTLHAAGRHVEEVQFAHDVAHHRDYN